jgi:hypothetical protein
LSSFRAPIVNRVGRCQIWENPWPSAPRKGRCAACSSATRCC